MQQMNEKWHCLCWSDGMVIVTLTLLPTLNTPDSPKGHHMRHKDPVKISLKITKTNEGFPDFLQKAVGAWRFISNGSSALRVLWDCQILFLVQICETMLFLNSSPVLLCMVQWHSRIHSLVAHLVLSVPKYKENKGWNFPSFGKFISFA